MFDDDPVSWIESSPDPAARWLLLTAVLGREDDDPSVIEAHRAVVAADGTHALVDRLTGWEAGEALSGHDSPKFAPNLLSLLADMGVRRGDFEAVDATLDQMLLHQDPSGRFMSFAPPRGGQAPAWGALLCDSHAIIETLVRYGHGTDARVRTGVDCMLADLADTDQGRAWPCRPDPRTGFRGPGRKADLCPQVTVEALRIAGRIPGVALRPDVVGAARVLLGVWTNRAQRRPYLFGHGRGFKTVKWPPTWYRVDAVLDAVSRFPSVWERASAHETDLQAVVEMAACLLAYNVDHNGRVTPRSTFKGFEAFTFGQKKEPSEFATARLLALLQPFASLASDVRAIDVSALTSSKGGTGTALPPQPAARRT
jgi:hypothetical protein